jgi:hypothetical protein
LANPEMRHGSHHLALEANKKVLILQTEASSKANRQSGVKLRWQACVEQKAK